MTNVQKLIKRLKRGWVDPDKYYQLTGSHCLSQMIGHLRRKHGIECEHKVVNVANGHWYTKYRMVKA